MEIGYFIAGLQSSFAEMTHIVFLAVNREINPERDVGNISLESTNTVQ
jgi:hypothetical protein